MKELTNRELEVLSLVVQGYSNLEIAEKLFVSKHTAKAHVCSILRKFSVKTRTQISYLAAKNNIIDLEEELITQNNDPYRL